ncbi:MAG: tyrosine-type recombinase/integrase [Nitriliruptoraceae bacterium]
MTVRVVGTGQGHRLVGEGATIEAANAFLGHLAARGYSPATVRAYAFDVANFATFLEERRLALSEVVPSDLFAYLDWQQELKPRQRRAGGKVVALARTGPAPATMNRRISAVRGLFEHQVMAGVLADNPVPAARRANGLRTPPRGMLGHVGPGRPRGGGRLVRQADRLPESIESGEVSTFLADLLTYRDRAIVLAMVLGGLRAGEVRSLRLADVDMGLGRVRVVGKGGRERIVPIERAFFVECAAYLREERPAGCATPECFVVLRGPTRSQAMTEAGLRKIFRLHRERSGARRVRPHRLRHTYGTELASAGIDLLVLRELMGHASPETTARYIHLSADGLAAEFAAARARMDR